MEGGVEGDHGLPARGEARDLDRVLDASAPELKKAARVGPAERSQLSEPLRELDVPGIGHDGEIGVDEPGRLLLDRLDDVGVAVADVAHADAAGEVDERVAVDVRDRRVQRLGGKNRQVDLQRLRDRAGAALEELARARAGDLGAKADRFRGRPRNEPTEPHGGYSRSVDPGDLDPDPHREFDRWFAEAAAAGVSAPEQMALATAGADGRPSVRMVLLKGHDERGFVFYTNRASRKAAELDANPWAAASAALGAAEPPGARRGSCASASATRSRSPTSTRGLARAR